MTLEKENNIETSVEDMFDDAGSLSDSVDEAADTEQAQHEEPELKKQEEEKSVEKDDRPYKEPVTSRFKNFAMSHFQKMTVDKIVKPKEEGVFTEQAILDLFDIEDTPEEKEAFLAEIKEQTEAEEVDLGLVELIKAEVIKDIKPTVSESYRMYEESQTVTADTFVRIQMWSYFPIIGTVIYLLMLLAITFDKKGKYPASLKNWAKAQLKFAWITVLVTALVVFVCVAAGISFLNIIQRGLSS